MKKQKIESLPQKPIIKQHIRNFFSTLKPGDELRTESICKYVKRNMGKTFYFDSCLRYLREMRQDGELNYTCVLKMDRIIRVINPGAPHSL